MKSKKSKTDWSPKEIKQNWLKSERPDANTSTGRTFWELCKRYEQLDVDPQRDDDASPMSTYRWDLLEKCLFQLFSTSQIQFRTFLKKKSNFWFPCCSTREDLSVDVSITYVGLIWTKPGRIFFSAYGNSEYGQNSISNFLKKIHIYGFPCCSTREDHSIDASITNVGLILTKLRWFQLFVKSKFKLFWKKNEFWGFHGVVLVKTFPLMYQLLL